LRSSQPNNGCRTADTSRVAADDHDQGNDELA
jgi:hypothetical protein